MTGIFDGGCLHLPSRNDTSRYATVSFANKFGSIQYQEMFGKEPGHFVRASGNIFFQRATR